MRCVITDYLTPAQQALFGTLPTKDLADDVDDDSSDDDSKSRAEELDDSDDAGPPALSQKKTHIGRRSAPQRAEHSGQGRKRSLAEVLDTRLSDINETLQHLLEAQQASLAIKKKRFEYLLSDDDVSSEEGSDMPLNLKKRTCTFCHDRRGLLTS